MRHFSD